MSQLPWLDHSHSFPPLSIALTEPNGLLAAGGDLSPSRILSAYAQGIFPWYSDDQPILWWSPNPRCILLPQNAHTSKSLKKHIRKARLSLTFDKRFEDVIHHCARTESVDGTWITEEMEAAYITLHKLGHAHSVEVWEDDQLVGGLYGLAIGKCFFGESMFSLRPNSSKVAFTSLCKQLNNWGYTLVDCQVENPHLISLGASSIDREQFLSILNSSVSQQPNTHLWQFDTDSKAL